MTIPGVQFVSDSEGRKTAVLIDLKRHRRLWEDIYDAMIAERRRDEPRLAWDEVKRRLRTGRRRRG